MEDNELDKLKSEVSRYTLTTNILNELLTNIEKTIIINAEQIIEANKKDIEVNKKQIKIKKLLEIVELYKNNEFNLNEDERKIVIYKGDPYLTLHIILQAITQRIKVLLIQDYFMPNVNKIMFNLITQVLRNYNIHNLIGKIEKYSEQEFSKMNIYYDETVVIGDVRVFNSLKENYNVKYYSYNNLFVYCDSKKLKRVQDAIGIYAYENGYEFEICEDKELSNVINKINSNIYANVAVLLTENIMIKNTFLNSVKDKEIFINENPFKNPVGKIQNYLA